MNIAYSADYKIVFAANAIKGRRYYCPVCNGKLHFYPGKKNVPHFRHGKGVSKEVKNNCELYSAKFSEFNMYDQEFEASQGVRLVLEKNNSEYSFSLKFPLIKKFHSDMQIHNLYFSYKCKQLKNFELNTVNLLPTRKLNCIPVPLLEKYSLVSSDEQYERKLELKISGDYSPFENGPLVFKEINGQYVSIPYRKIFLSGRFFIVIKSQIMRIHKNLDLLNYIKLDDYHVYEFIVPLSYTDDLQRWFTINLNYSLMPATCHLDIVSPVHFKKIGTRIEITSQKSVWKLTNIGERPFKQRLVVINPSNDRETFSVSNEEEILINLKGYGDYLVYLDQEISELLTIRYVPSIEHTIHSVGNLNVNKNNVLFKVSELHTESVTIQADFPVSINSQEEILYKIKKDTVIDLHSPVRIDFPRVWSLTVVSEDHVKHKIEDLYNIYETHRLYPKVICDFKMIDYIVRIVKKSNFKYRDKLLLSIRKLGINVPSPVLQIIKFMED